MGLHKLQIQTSQLQTGVGKCSATLNSLVLGTSKTAKVVHSLDPWAIVLLDEALTIEVEADRATVSALKNIGLNLALVPIEALQTPQAVLITKI